MILLALRELAHHDDRECAPTHWMASNIHLATARRTRPRVRPRQRVFPRTVAGVRQMNTLSESVKLTRDCLCAGKMRLALTTLGIVLGPTLPLLRPRELAFMAEG